MTRLITQADPVLQTGVDIALAPDLTAPPESWTWTPMDTYTDGRLRRPRLLNQTIEITHGRQDESRLADPTEVEILLGNGDLALTPRNPQSPYWPGLKRGTPLRVVVRAGSRYLLFTGLTGSRATTPDNAALDITGPLAGAIQFRSPLAVGPVASAYKVMGKWAAGQRSYRLLLAADGEARLRWSTDGTNEIEARTSFAVPRPEAGPLTVAWELQTNNGAGGNTTTWYVGKVDLDELLADKTAYLFGDPWINSGVTSIFSGSAVLDLGDNTGSGFPALPGGIERFQLRAGDLTTGTIAANLDCTGLTVGATGTTDSAGRVWTFSAAEITNRQPRFTGRVDKVTAEWEQADETNPLVPTIAAVTVSASGILERLAGGNAIDSALYRRITAPVSDVTVYDYYPLEDGSDSTGAFAPIGGAPNGIVALNRASDDTLPASRPLPGQSGGQPFGWNLGLSGTAPATGWEWTYLVNIPIAPVAASGESLILGRIDIGSGTTSSWGMRIDDTNWSIFARDNSDTIVLNSSTSSDPRMFGGWMIIQVTLAQSGGNIAWDVDLIPIDLGLNFGNNGTLASQTLGPPTRLRNLDPFMFQEGASWGHMMITSGAVAGWLAPADSAYLGEPAPCRVFRLCRELGVPIAVDGPVTGATIPSWAPALAAGAQPMGFQRPGKLVDLLDECAEVDDGFLGEQRGGLGLTYRSGSTLLNQPIRLLLAQSQRRVIAPFSEVDDDLRFANDVIVSRPEGSSYRIEDPSIATGDEERYQQTAEVNVYSDDDLPGQAGWRYHLGTWPEPRFPELWTDVAKDATMVDDLLGVGIGDRIGIPDPPPGCPPVDQLVDGITEQLERFQWRVGFNGHPARPRDVGVLDDDTPTTALRRLVDDGSTLAAGLTTTQTGAVSVTVTGKLWTTSAAQFPMDVEIAGEVVTLSGITGGASPQTFTISARSVNGAEKAHSAGETVAPYEPLRVRI